MSLNAAQMSKLVDDYWQDAIQETDEFSHSFCKRVEGLPDANAGVNGRKVKVRTSYNASWTTAGANGATVAQGDSSEFQNLFVPYRYATKTCLFTKEALDNDDGNAKYHPMIEELASARLEAYKNLNRHFLMGDTLGTIGVTTAVESGSTITCAPGTGYGNKGAQFIRPGKVVQIYDATGATQRTGGGADKLTVASVVKSTGVVTFTSAAPTDVVATDIVVDADSVTKGIAGTEYIVANTGPYYELSRATYPGLQSTMIDGSTGSIVLLCEKMFAKSAFQTGTDSGLGINGSTPREGWWSPTQRQAYRQDSIGLGITMLGSDKLDAGYAHMEEINAHKFTCEPDHSNTKIQFLKMGDFRKIVRGNAEKPFEIIPFYGESVYPITDSSNGYPTTQMATTLGAYVNLHCEDLRGQAAIYSLPTSGLETGNS